MLIGNSFYAMDRIYVCLGHNKSPQSTFYDDERMASISGPAHPMVVNGSVVMNLTYPEEVSKTEASLKKLLHDPDQVAWQRLPFSHWPMLFGLYNMSLYGQHITILPPIRLSMTISPEVAISLRHPAELNEVRLQIS